MRKPFLCMIPLLGLAYSQSFAQTNTFPTSGNVGIGTTTPSSILHIVPNPTTDGGIKYNNQINGYSSLIWASNNVGLGLVSGGGLHALANPGYGFTIGSGASNTSLGAMLNIKGSGAT